MRKSGIAVLLAALLLAGCGGSGKPAAKPNGEASKPAATVLADAKNATTHAKSVRLSGHITTGGKAVTLDLTIVRGQGGKGTMSLNGLSFDLVTLGGKAYIKGSNAFYTHFAGATAAGLLHGRWVEGSTTAGKLAQLAEFANVGALYTLVASLGSMENQGETTYRGQKAVAIHDATQSATLYVAATGTPYPIAAVATGANKGTVTFGDWNAAASITAPKGAINLSTLGAG